MVKALRGQHQTRRAGRDKSSLALLEHPLPQQPRNDRLPYPQ